MIPLFLMAGKIFVHFFLVFKDDELSFPDGWKNLCSLPSRFRDDELFFPNGWKNLCSVFCLYLFANFSSSIKSLGEFSSVFLILSSSSRLCVFQTFKRLRGIGFVCEVSLQILMRNCIEQI